jgi:ferric iron reductase protein FhuF
VIAQRCDQVEALLAVPMEPGTSARLHDPAAAPAGWVPLVSLIRDPAVLAGRATDVRRVLERGAPAPVTSMVALSLVSLRLCGGLVLPVLTCAAAGIALSADAQEVVLDWEPSHLAVSFPSRDVHVGPDEALPALIEAVLAPIGAVLAELALPSRVFWGNAASVIARSADLIAAQHLDLGPTARRQARSALQMPRLASAWAGGLGPTFRRTSCCQVVDRGEPSGRCGDCVRAPGTMSSCPVPT